MKVKDTVKHLMRQGKGILAADESTPTITQRFETFGIVSTEETRRTYRELLVTTPGAEKYLSGIIFYDETLRQALSDGTPFSEFLFARNVLSGIKVDQGIEHDAQFQGDVTKGLDGLDARLGEYATLGATFTKWRAVFRVGEPHGAPSVRENASRLAAYAERALAAGFAPLVEPEVLMDGAHSASDAEETITEVMAVVVDALGARSIDMKNVIIKSAMAVSGADNPARAEPREVAERTVRALTASLPDDIGGVAFLSGGQTPEEATANLNAIARIEPLPWEITFSFSRALQSPVMERWRGVSENASDAQSIFLERLSLAVEADAASYDPREEEGALENL